MNDRDKVRQVQLIMFALYRVILWHWYGYDMRLVMIRRKQ